MKPLLKGYADTLRYYHSVFDYSLFKLFNKPQRINPASIKRIVCIEFLYIGDLIVTTPAIRALKETFPQAEITFVLPTGMGLILEKNPNVKHVIELDKKQLTKKGINQLSKSLRSMQFDVGVLFYPGNKLISGLLKKSKIPIRVGCSKTGFSEGKGKYLTHKVRPTKEFKHFVDENLDVVRLLNAETNNKSLELYTNAELKNFFSRNSIKSGTFVIVVHPGPRNPTHKWLNLRFSAVIDALIEKYDAKIILTGTKHDADDIQEIEDTTKHDVISAVSFSLNEFFTIIKRANLVVSVDTGAMHVAAAFGSPVVALFGAGDPKVWRPYNEKVRVLFKPQVCTTCHRYHCRFSGSNKQICMKMITVEDVLDACDQLVKPLEENLNYPHTG